ncbi:conserved phage C-terminal domain-containing protein [Oenococcus sp.]|uniref:conserved phage C-terminal domain-containing protein n=1 Tax=Oenococcus sp. TaxID=1979414 RepID=UPI0039ECA879
MTEHYITIPDSLFALIPNDSERLLIGDLINLSSIDGYAHPSDTWLTDRYHTNTRTIQRRLAHLEELGLIRRETKHKGYSDMDRKIYITIETVITHDKNDVREASTGDKNVVRTHDKNDTRTHDKIVVQNNLTNNLVNNLSDDMSGKPDLTPPSSPLLTIAKRALDYFNQQSDRKFNPKAAKNTAPIVARLKEGFTADDLKTVIDRACQHWKGKSAYDHFLRPETIFNNRFDERLNDTINWEFSDFNKAAIQKKETLIDYGSQQKTDNSQAIQALAKYQQSQKGADNGPNLRG